MSAKTLEAAPEALLIRVDDVTRIAGSYARLGLRVLERGRAKAVIELPCGVTLVLSGTAPSRCVAAA